MDSQPATARQTTRSSTSTYRQLYHLTQRPLLERRDARRFGKKGAPAQASIEKKMSLPSQEKSKKSSKRKSLAGGGGEVHSDVQVTVSEPSTSVGPAFGKLIILFYVRFYSRCHFGIRRTDSTYQ